MIIHPLVNVLSVLYLVYLAVLCFFVKERNDSATGCHHHGLLQIQKKKEALAAGRSESWAAKKTSAQFEACLDGGRVMPSKMQWTDQSNAKNGAFATDGFYLRPTWLAFVWQNLLGRGAPCLELSMLCWHSESPVLLLTIATTHDWSEEDVQI